MQIHIVKDGKFVLLLATLFKVKKKLSISPSTTNDFFLAY